MLAPRARAVGYRHKASFINFCIAAQPSWVQKISDVHAAIEESVFWECRASGRPKPSYRWLKDGEPLLPQVGTAGILHQGGGHRALQELLCSTSFFISACFVTFGVELEGTAVL